MTPRSLLTHAAALLVVVLGASFGGCGLPTSGVEAPTEGKACSTAAQCDDQNPCTLEECGSEGICVVSNAADGPSAEQTAKDCKQALCAAGVVSSENDDDDIEDDGNDCTLDTCAAGAASHTVVEPNTMCTLAGVQGQCDELGECQVKCTDDSFCDDDQACTIDACDIAAGNCIHTPLDAVPVPNVTQVTGDCRVRLCVSGVDQNAVDDTDLPDQPFDDFCQQKICSAGAVSSIPDDNDLPIDNNICTDDFCAAGVPSNPPVAQGTNCGGALVCDNGLCKGCLANGNGDQCPGTDDDCKDRTCDSQGVCGVTFTPAGTETFMNPAQIGSDCKVKVCDGNGNVNTINKDTDFFVDGNACTSDICLSGAPQNPPLPVGSPCSVGGNTVCDNGACVQCVNNNQCTPPQTCAGAGVPDQCGCTPFTQAVACAGGKNCGMVPNGCGGMLSCGNCGGTETCGGGTPSVPNVCGCTPNNNACSGKDCGMVTGNCGQTLTCAPNSCSGMGVTCGGGGTPNLCGCTPNNSACSGKDCGTVTGNCGQTLTCAPNSCSGTGASCGGGGTPNLCGCTPNNNACSGKDCGTVAGNCGQTLTCQPNNCMGTGVICGGGGTPNLCGCTPMTQAVACAGGKNCGNVPNGCGGMLSCGTCAAGSSYPTCNANVCQCSGGSCGGMSCTNGVCECNGAGDCNNGGNTCNATPNPNLCNCGGADCTVGQTCSGGGACTCTGGHCPP